MGRIEVSTSILKVLVGVSIIIRRHTDHMNFVAYMAVPFITFSHNLLVLFCILFV